MAESWFDGLERCEVFIYRRPDFLADDFEYEQFVGQKYLRNLFKEQKVDDQTTEIILVFPERWINCIECHQLFPRLQKYYPNLKTLQIKTHQPLVITGVPNKYAYLFTEENEIVRLSGTSGHLNRATSIEDPAALFKDISKGKLFSSSSKLSSV